MARIHLHETEVGKFPSLSDVNNFQPVPSRSLNCLRISSFLSSEFFRNG